MRTLYGLRLLFLSILFLGYIWSLIFSSTTIRHALSIQDGLTCSEPWCFRCNNHKPRGTHHCSICERCVLHMDHHCIWINQCVGLHNHRYFFLFVVFVWISQCLILFSNYDTFWEHLSAINNPSSMPFCVEDISYAPWREWMCATMSHFINSCICFNYGLAVLLFFVLGGFTAWNVYLISIGETFIDFMQHVDERRERKGWRSPSHLGFSKNWRRFFALTNGRTFARNILLPSSHPDQFEKFVRDNDAVQMV